MLGSEGDDDGRLNAAEIASFDLSADLVVLSARDTGASAFQSGERILGLPFAFAVAGSKATIQTLWPIYDDATAVFISRSFAINHAGANAVRALTLAKCELEAGPPAYGRRS